MVSYMLGLYTFGGPGAMDFFETKISRISMLEDLRRNMIFI